MTEHDLIVLGGGTGNVVASAAATEGLDVGLVERGRLGGTCLNRGCNPSKKLLQRASVAEAVRNADAFGIDASIDGIAFADVVDEVTASVDAAAEEKTERAREDSHIALYQSEGRFVDERTVEVDGERLTADRVVLAGGARPLVPDAIDGTDDVAFLTSDEALRLRDRPDRLVVVGGGYVAVEMAHFFGQMGADVVIVGRGTELAAREDEDVAQRLTAAYREKHELHLGFEATAVESDGDERTVRAESDGGEEIAVSGDELLLATGREPNSDLWNVSAAGIDTDERGFVETDEYLRTSADGVWAIGDVAGNYMLKHAGDEEAKYAVENAVRGNERRVQYPGMARAVFGSPQVASLGRTEGELDEGADYEVGTYSYDEQALGAALRNDDGFAKVLVGADGTILGCHIVGPDASTLIHEVSTAVAAGADAETVAKTIHVHPALSEVVQGAFRDVRGDAPTGV